MLPEHRFLRLKRIGICNRVTDGFTSASVEVFGERIAMKLI